MNFLKTQNWKKFFQISLVAISTFGLFQAQAQAQAFPNKPVKLIVTYPPGGSSDLMARIMGQKLSEVWGQPVIIESKPGAAGSIGMEFAARQPADGYTFVVGNLGPASVNPLITKVPYSMEKDFIPVSLTATGPNILVVPSSSPFKKSISIAARTSSSSVAVREGSQPKNKSGQLHTVALHVRAQDFCMHSLDAPYPGTLGVV
jgi:tripartite-type tricarboxylate transporter receptor subunit TctC